VTEPSHQEFLLRALHQLGDILYFHDDEELRDTVVLKPQWVNEYIAKVLDSAQVAETRGLLTRDHERQLWSALIPACATGSCG
jgi:internalin A